MSDILIRGMEMPKEDSWRTVRIYPDGTCAVPNWQGDCTFIKGTKAIPAADVAPVKHGRWIDTDNYYMRWKCSECGNHTRDARPPYCPNCGVKMDLKEETK